jgi:hypothetical protein
LIVEFCGEQHEIEPGSSFSIGRDGALDLDDNPYLHRRFLVVLHDHGFWWLANEGSRLSATVSDADGSMQAWLAPSARLPIVFRRTSVRFTAGPTTYQLDLIAPDPPFLMVDGIETSGESTIGTTALTAEQHLLIVALAEPMLRGDGQGTVQVPSSAEAAVRLGWSISKFNRKLDNVCAKLAKVGVRGLHGSSAALASQRRARLVEYALSARLIEPADLERLEVQEQEV